MVLITSGDLAFSRVELAKSRYAHHTGTILGVVGDARHEETVSKSGADTRARVGKYLYDRANGKARGGRGGHWRHQLALRSSTINASQLPKAGRRFGIIDVKCVEPQPSLRQPIVTEAPFFKCCRGF